MIHITKMTKVPRISRRSDASKIVKYSGRVYFVAGLFALRNHDISRAVFVRLRSRSAMCRMRGPGIAFVHGEMDVASVIRQRCIAPSPM